jgi:hypothetical protein
MALIPSWRALLHERSRAWASVRSGGLVVSSTASDAASVRPMATNSVMGKP